jgi:hypothetical protein
VLRLSSGATVLLKPLSTLRPSIHEAATARLKAFFFFASFVGAAAAQDGLSSSLEQEMEQAKRALAVALGERAKRAPAQDATDDGAARQHGTVHIPGTAGLPLSDRATTAAPVQVAPRREWWVIVGSYPEAASGLDEETEKITAAVLRCGLRPVRDQSRNYDGFAPGHSILVLDSLTDRASAQQLLQQVRPCVRGAYMKQGQRHAPGGG